MTASRARAVLITGAGGGLGGATARVFASRGWQVFAADLTPPPEEPGVTPLQLDVTDPASVDDALSKVGAAVPVGLDCVVNFAGILVVGPLVEIDDDRMRRILDVNVLGTYRVNKAAFPLVHRARGRIVNVSSETGWQRALMMNGPYAMSKHAIEAYSDALRRELMFLGVRVVVIQPGPFRTDMTGGIGDAFTAAVRPGSPFAGLLGKTGRLAAREEGNAHDPAELANVIWTAATARRPRIRYSVRPDPRRRLLHHLPARLVDALLKRLLAGASPRTNR